MAQYNLIQRPDLNDRLVRALGIRERAPASVLSPEVMPVILLEDLTTSSPFERSLTRQAGGFINIGPVGGQYSHLALYNPAGSGTVARLDHVAAWTGATSSIYLGAYPAAPPAGTGSRFFADPRFGGSPTCQLRNGTTGVLSTLPQYAAGTIASTTVQFDDLGMIVPPGFLVAVSVAAVNVQLSAAFQWVEFTS